MKILHTALMVFDLAKSLDFYVSKLGFKEEFRVVSPDKKFTKVFLFLEKGGHQIELIHDSSRKKPYQTGDGLAHIAFKVNDIDKVHKVLIDVAANNTEVCKTPEPRVRFRAFGNSSLDHELLCWVDKPVLRGKVLHILNTEIYKRFLKEGIEIPFPQQDVHIRSASIKDNNRE